MCSAYEFLLTIPMTSILLSEELGISLFFKKALVIITLPFYLQDNQITGVLNNMMPFLNLKSNQCLL